MREVLLEIFQKYFLQFLLKLLIPFLSLYFIYPVFFYPLRLCLANHYCTMFFSVGLKAHFSRGKRGKSKHFVEIHTVQVLVAVFDDFVSFLVVSAYVPEVVCRYIVQSGTFQSDEAIEMRNAILVFQRPAELGLKDI